MIYKDSLNLKPSSFTRYYEYMGGLGDVILRLHTSPWYASLEDLAPGEEAAIVLMSHNAGVSEIWRWHPKADQIHVFDLGFNTPFHPWENAEWRNAHGLPPNSPCPPPANGSAIRFYPSKEDLVLLNILESRKPYAIFSPVAGTPERTFPPDIQKQLLRSLMSHGIRPVLVGSSLYGRPEAEHGCMNLVDKLSVPGVIEAIRRADLVLTAHTSTLHMAWFSERPVFLLYPKWVREVYEKHGPIGYFFGVNQKTTDHMDFQSYTLGRFEKFVGAILEGARCGSTS